MKTWKTSNKILVMFGICLAVFVVLRFFVSAEYSLSVLTIPGAIFVGYMANLGANMIRNPPPPSDESDDATRTDR